MDPVPHPPQTHNPDRLQAFIEESSVTDDQERIIAEITAKGLSQEEEVRQISEAVQKYFTIHYRETYQPFNGHEGLEESVAVPRIERSQLAETIEEIKARNLSPERELEEIETASYQFYQAAYVTTFIGRAASPPLSGEVAIPAPGPNWQGLKSTFLSYSDPLTQICYMYEQSTLFPRETARIVVELTSLDDVTLPKAWDELYDLALDHIEERMHRMRLKMHMREEVNAADVVHFANSILSYLHHLQSTPRPEKEGLSEIFSILKDLLHNALANQEQKGIERETMIATLAIWNREEIHDLTTLQKILDEILSQEAFNHPCSRELISCYTSEQKLTPIVQLAAPLDPNYVFSEVKEEIVRRLKEHEGITIESANIDTFLRKESANAIVQYYYVAAVMEIVAVKLVEPLEEESEQAVFDRFCIDVTQLFPMVHTVGAIRPSLEELYSDIFRDVQKLVRAFSKERQSLLQKWQSDSGYDLSWSAEKKLLALSSFVLALVNSVSTLSHRRSIEHLQKAMLNLPTPYIRAIENAIASHTRADRASMQTALTSKKGSLVDKSRDQIKGAAEKIAAQLRAMLGEEEVSAAGEGAMGSPLVHSAESSPTRPRNSPLKEHRPEGSGLLRRLFGGKAAAAAAE